METPFPLGRKVNHDSRSLAFPAPFEGVIVQSKRWRRFGICLDQGQLGSCVGNALAGLRNHEPNHEGLPVLHEPEAVGIYSLATELDPFDGTYPPSDTGSDGNSGAAASRQLGYITGWTHAFGVEHVLVALMTGPLTIGTDWHEDMFDPDSKGLVHPTGPVVGGHQYVLDGWDAVHGIFRFNNSWSNSWGDNGRFYMTYADLDTLLGRSGDAIQIQV